MATQKIEPKQLDFSDLPDGDVTNAGGTLGTIKHNRAAGASPTGSDNFASGWALGSTWIYGSTEYLCVGDGSWVQTYPADATNAIGTLPVSKGGTGATDAAGARTNLGAAAVSHGHSTNNISDDSTWAGTDLTDTLEAISTAIDGTEVELSHSYPSGTKNGANYTFTLSAAISDGDIVTCNGQALEHDVDYTAVGTALTFLTFAPESDDIIEVRRVNGNAMVPPGRVSGPVSSSDNSIARFDGVSGSVIQGSTATIDDDGAIGFPDVSDPVAPADGVKVFAMTSCVNRERLAYVGPNGVIVPVQPSLAHHYFGVWQPPGGATTVPGVMGWPTMTVVGTATTRTCTATSTFTRTKRLGYVSAATAGSLVSQRAAALNFSAGDGSGLGGFYLAMSFGISDAATVAGARMFVGMQNLTSAPTNVEPSSLTNCIGLAQLSSDSTQLYICYGGSTAQTPIALGTNFPANNSGKLLRLQIYAPSDEANTFYYQVDNINDRLSTSGTLTGGSAVVPQSTTFLSGARNWRCNNATALAVAMDWAGLYMMEEAYF